jgi:hypothetical protein
MAAAAVSSTALAAGDRNRLWKIIENSFSVHTSRVSGQPVRP